MVVAVDNGVLTCLLADDVLLVGFKTSMCPCWRRISLCLKAEKKMKAVLNLFGAPGGFLYLISTRPFHVPRLTARSGLWGALCSFFFPRKKTDSSCLAILIGCSSVIIGMGPSSRRFWTWRHKTTQKPRSVKRKFSSYFVRSTSSPTTPQYVLYVKQLKFLWNDFEINGREDMEKLWYLPSIWP